jgi:heme exporter protein D
MMPDLGRYATEVIASYVVSLAALAALIVYFLMRGARMRRQLDEIEARRRRNNG